MGRLVQPAQITRVPVSRGSGLESTVGSRDVPMGGDSYQDKIAKYIPGEVVAAYMALDRTLVPDPATFQDKAAKLAALPGQVAGQLESVKPGVRTLGFFNDPANLVALHNSLPLLILLVGLVVTPLYIRQLSINEGGTSSAWKSQALISTFAFVVWAYAIQGSAFTSGHLQGAYAGAVASALLIVFTLVSGLFGPAPVRHGDGAR
jgi:hypothetical protein